MRVRLYWFVLTQRGPPWRVLLVAVCVLAVFASLVPVVAARQEYTLSVQLSEPEFASAVEVRTAEGAAMGQLTDRTGDLVRFTLRRGDYLVTAQPTAIALQQHWAYAVVPIHLDHNLGLSLRGNYGTP